MSSYADRLNDDCRKISYQYLVRYTDLGICQGDRWPCGTPKTGALNHPQAHKKTRTCTAAGAGGCLVGYLHRNLKPVLQRSCPRCSQVFQGLDTSVRRARLKQRHHEIVVLAEPPQDAGGKRRRFIAFGPCVVSKQTREG